MVFTDLGAIFRKTFVFPKSIRDPKSWKLRSENFYQNFGDYDEFFEFQKEAIPN